MFDLGFCRWQTLFVVSSFCSKGVHSTLDFLWVVFSAGFPSRWDIELGIVFPRRGSSACLRNYSLRLISCLNLLTVFAMSWSGTEDSKQKRRFNPSSLPLFHGALSSKLNTRSWNFMWITIHRIILRQGHGKGTWHQMGLNFISFHLK